MLKQHFNQFLGKLSHWKYLLLIITLVFIVVIFDVLTNTPTINKGGRQKIKTDQLSYQKIIPGITTKGEIVTILGKPEKIAIVENVEIFNYKNSDSKWNDQIYVQKNVVSFVKEIITDSNASRVSPSNIELINPEVQLFGPIQSGGYISDPSYQLESFPSRGIALLKSNPGNIIYQIWYFPVMEIDTFIAQMKEKEDMITREDFINITGRIFNSVP